MARRHVVGLTVGRSIGGWSVHANEGWLGCGQSPNSRGLVADGGPDATSVAEFGGHFLGPGVDDCPVAVVTVWGAQ